MNRITASQGNSLKLTGSASLPITQSSAQQRRPHLTLQPTTSATTHPNVSSLSTEVNSTLQEDRTYCCLRFSSYVNAFMCSGGHAASARSTPSRGLRSTPSRYGEEGWHEATSKTTIRAENEVEAHREANNYKVRLYLHLNPPVCASMHLIGLGN